MPHTIQENCNICDSCQPQCNKGAIKKRDNGSGYWIDPTLCDNCQGLPVPRCVSTCDVGALSPLPPKKGRCKSKLLPPAIPEIFLNGKTTPFASSMVMWETCNILAQQYLLPWSNDADGKYHYYRSVHRGRGNMCFRLAANPESDQPSPMAMEDAKAAIANFDIRATCIHLIFAAYSMNVDTPWQESFTLNDQHIEQYLGLKKRKDLTKLEKLTLIKSLVYQACQILVAIDWPRQGKVQGFTLDEHPVWHLIDTKYYFETDAQGRRHLIGLSFTIQAGIWAKYFLNKRDYRQQIAFYQYGTLPQSLISMVMSSWQQYEGAIRLLLWLLFKLRLGGDQRLTVRTLLRIGYGEERLREATTIRGAHKRLLKTFENNLEMLYVYGLKPLFDPETYSHDIQPLWAKASNIPNDTDAAIDFWIDDANRDLSLTDSAPRDKWQRLLNARILGFELSEDWQQSVRRRSSKRRRHKSKSSSQSKDISAFDIKTARKQQQLSQRALAESLGKSQSWIRDIEKGRYSMTTEDQMLLRQTLKL